MSDTKPAPGKWRQLTLLSLVQLFAMGLWFSASAVVPQLVAEWSLSGGEAAWVTMAVQVGFVVGALASAAFNLADIVPARWLFAWSALAGALVNAAIVVADSPLQVLGLRLLTGVALAGVYPPGMKLAASWTLRDRGLGIGLLVAALTAGKALPHLLNALPVFGAGGLPPWRLMVLVSSVLAIVAALLAATTIRPGPHLARSAPFDIRFARRAFAHRPTRLANYGYLGHMWELYAMWTWLPLFLLAAYEHAGWSAAAARVAGFAVIFAGALGSLVAGLVADRLGRTRVTIWSLAVSGGCALVAGLLFASPALLTALAIVWGFAVVADSAQFSAAVSELTDKRYVGTALTLQTSLGFLLTLVSLRLVPALVESAGWWPAFALLALGPAFGIWSMARLRRLPEATRMASGNR